MQALQAHSDDHDEGAAFKAAAKLADQPDTGTLPVAFPAQLMQDSACRILQQAISPMQASGESGNLSWSPPAKPASLLARVCLCVCGLRANAEGVCGLCANAEALCQKA